MRCLQTAGSLAAVLILGVAAGCGPSVVGAGGVGAAGGGPGSTGTGGTIGAMCPAAVAATGGIGADGLPFCSVAARPLDPMNVYLDAAVSDAAVSDAAVSDAAVSDAAVSDAAADTATRISTVPNTSNDDDNCNGLQTGDAGADVAALDCLAGPWCTPESFTAVDDGGASVDGGGVAVDGGTPERPTGGALVDGEYQLVRYRSKVANGHASKRTIGVYDGATYVEWAADEKGGSAFGADQILRLNTTMSVGEFDWKVVAVNCGSLGTTGYGYTVSGTELELFDIDASGVLQNVYTYQRTCSR